MPSKTIDTLIDDIYGLVGSDNIELNEDLLNSLGGDLANLMRMRLSEPRGPARLRMSALGKPDRQLWYEIKSDLAGEVLPDQVQLKFMFGDLWELVLLFLAEAAGHEVVLKQAEVELNGVVGHIDAIIDGVVVDVKSASTFAFRKFDSGTLPDDDPFGYMEQLAGYCTALEKRDGAFLAVDKTTGKLALLRFPYSDLEPYCIEERIDHLKSVLASDETPERCFEPVPEGKSGNMVLGINCSYCPFKHHCWSDVNGGIGLRTFIYSTGPKHFVKVVKEPKTFEVTI